MTTKAEKLRVLDEVQQLLGMKDEDIARVPEAIKALLQQVAVEPCLVSFAFNPLTGKLQQLAMSTVPQVPEAYHAVAQVTTRVAQQFSNIAMEVAKRVGQEGRMAEGDGPRGGDELGAGVSPDGPEVGQVSVGDGGPGDDRQ